MIIPTRAKINVISNEFVDDFEYDINGKKGVKAKHYLVTLSTDVVAELKNRFDVIETRTIQVEHDSPLPEGICEVDICHALKGKNIAIKIMRVIQPKQQPNKKES